MPHSGLDDLRPTAACDPDTYRVPPDSQIELLKATRSSLSKPVGQVDQRTFPGSKYLLPRIECRGVHQGSTFIVIVEALPAGQRSAAAGHARTGRSITE